MAQDVSDDAEYRRLRGELLAFVIDTIDTSLLEGRDVRLGSAIANAITMAADDAARLAVARHRLADAASATHVELSAADVQRIVDAIARRPAFTSSTDDSGLGQPTADNMRQMVEPSDHDGVASVPRPGRLRRAAFLLRVRNARPAVLAVGILVVLLVSACIWLHEQQVELRQQRTVAVDQVRRWTGAVSALCDARGTTRAQVASVTGSGEYQAGIAGTRRNPLVIALDAIAAANAGAAVCGEQQPPAAKAAR